MTSLLGQHWIRVHPDQLDYSHVERMQYKSTKLFEWQWSDRDACNNLLAVLPKDSYILARDHPMSEQKGDMWADPIGTGTRHANEWALKVASGNVHVPTDRTFFLGINEPDATNGDRAAIDRYTTAFLDRLRVHGLRGGAFNFSTGHPRTVDGTGNTQADYTVFEGSHQAIVRGHHIAVAHIYGSSTMPCVPGHYDRLKACTWQDVEWVIGECGSDEHVTTGGAHDGYLRTMNPPDYCRWLDEFIMGINDARIHSYQVFTYDYSHPWDSFDVRPIRDALESYDWQHTKHPPTQPTPDTPPFVTHLPAVENGNEQFQLYVTAPSGANIRSEPTTDSHILTAVPYGAPVWVGSEVRGDWLPVRHGAVDGWMHKMLLGTKPTVTEPEPTPPPQPTPQPQDNWSRSRAFVKRWEGGFQDHDWDAGNWTECEVGKGEKKGTNFGISACSYPDLDIRNITQEQADAIYFSDYWQESGADQLAWPMCLLVYNVAVNFGVGNAVKWLEQSKGDPLHFTALMLRGYRKSKAWPQAGNAWVDRSIEAMLEASEA